MKKKLLINYWNKYYRKDIKLKESSFARFVKKKIRVNSEIIDIGCGNGRDSFFFSKNKFKVTAIDISKNAIKVNSLKTNKNLKFLEFDIGKNKLKKKFDVFYCRFFIHAINNEDENKLMLFLKKNKKKNSLAFFEFRNHNDKIFEKIKKKQHNNIVEFEKGHFRRIINPKKFIKKVKDKNNAIVIYKKSSKNFSILKGENPNLTRIVFKL